jgi:dTDP-4-dehydrorhamnose 3,5-epimerase
MVSSSSTVPVPVTRVVRSPDALDAAGVDLAPFRWVSRSVSVRATIRGLHTRVGGGERKIVSCIAGRAFDVLVDVRPQSLTFGQVETFQLRGDDLTCLVVPAGVAHGFQALVDATVMSYMIDRAHDASDERVIAFDDEALGIHWPLGDPVLSERDRHAPRLHEAIHQWGQSIDGAGQREYLDVQGAREMEGRR